MDLSRIILPAGGLVLALPPALTPPPRPLCSAAPPSLPHPIGRIWIRCHLVLPRLVPQRCPPRLALNSKEVSYHNKRKTMLPPR